MKIVYPATIEKIDNQYWLEFPDLEGCHTWADSLEEVIAYASKALEGYVLSCMENNLPISKASELKNIPTGDNIVTTYIYCDIQVKSATPIKKTLTIPSWVNQIGIEKNINFSQTLTDAIIGIYSKD